MATVIELQNITSGALFRLFTTEVQNLDFNYNKRKFTEPIADDDGDNAISINLGVLKEWSFPFKLTNTTSTSESASGTGTIYTPDQKQSYIRETFLSGGIEDLYLLSIFADNGTILNLKGDIDRLNISFNAQNPGFLTGALTFAIGGGAQ